jgi:hypothetical protein
MTGEMPMRLVSINKAMPKMLGRAPHKFYILEMSIGDLEEFKQSPREVLCRFRELSDIDPRTNIHVTAVDGDKGDLPTDYIKKTHAFVMDFRPLGVEVVYWACALEWYEKFEAKERPTERSRAPAAKGRVAKASKTKTTKESGR